MRSFAVLTAPAATLAIAHVDTDQILPARFMITQSRKGLGKHLFHDWRFDRDGVARQDFVLNRSPGDRAGILIAFENFGCGSSREHAVWALDDFGIRCVVAPSFGDIFASNCTKNGILLIRLPHRVCDQLASEAQKNPNRSMTVELEPQQLTSPLGTVHRFEIDQQTKDVLLAGLDDISRTLRHESAIAAFEDMRLHRAGR